MSLKNDFENPDAILVQNNNEQAEKFWEETHKRIVKACLLVAILKKLSITGIISPSAIITFFKTEYNIKLSPGTVYPIFIKLEKLGDIEKLPKKPLAFLF